MRNEQTELGWEIFVVDTANELALRQVKSLYAAAFAEMTSFELGPDYLPLPEDLTITPTQNGFSVMHLHVFGTCINASAGLEQVLIALSETAAKVAAAMRQENAGIGLSDPVLVGRNTDLLGSARREVLAEYTVKTLIGA